MKFPENPFKKPNPPSKVPVIRTQARDVTRTLTSNVTRVRFGSIFTLEQGLVAGANIGSILLLGILGAGAGAALSDKVFGTRFREDQYGKFAEGMKDLKEAHLIESSSLSRQA